VDTGDSNLDFNLNFFKLLKDYPQYFDALADMEQFSWSVERCFLKNILQWVNFIFGKIHSWRGNVLMDAEKMLEIIETGAWFPRKKVDNEKLQAK
jgi:hypothetical protein